MKIPFLRTPYNYDRDQVSDETALRCMDPSLAQQQFKEESDINTLVERFHLTGEMPQLTQLPSYGDYTGIFDYQSAMNALVATRETFQSLPAKLRARFHNDPQEFLEFCQDDENHAEARRMGLLKLDATPLAPPDQETPPAPPSKPQGDPKPAKPVKKPPAGTEDEAQ